MKETLFRIKNKIEIRPVCKTCGGKVAFSGTKKVSFYEHCSCRCTQLDKNVRDKNKETCLQQYGVENGAQAPEIQAKMKATCLKRYGAENAFASEIIKQKIKEQNLQKYGVENAAQRKDIIEKRKATCIKKYGLPDPRTIGLKHVSKGETDLFNECKKIYNGTIIQNDRAVIFPMELDIWIPDLNIGIEYDGDYWHSLDDMKERDIKKDKICFEKGIRLLRIKESEYVENKEIILNKIKMFLVEGINKND